MTVKVGVLGIGRWGVNHVRVYKELMKEVDVELVGVYDIDPSKKKVAEAYGTPFYTSLKDLLLKVDAVSVVTPTDTHYQVVEECIEEGKHVLVEKPFVLNTEQAKKLVTLARNKGIILNVGYLYRFNPVVKKLKEMVNSNLNIRSITARYVQPKPPRSDCGAIFNLTVHLIDILNFILDKKPITILCKAGYKISEPNKLEDCATVILGYDDFYALLEVASLHPHKIRDMFILSSSISYYADFYGQTLEVYEKVEGIEEWRKRAIEIEKKEPLKEELKHFVLSVKGEIDDNLGEEEIYTTLICEKAIESSRTGMELRIA